MRTQVAIIGAGPAGLLLSHLLAAAGLESVIVETRTREYVEARIRAGILEQSTVNELIEAGLGNRLLREGDEHRGIYLQWPNERHHIDFVDLIGKSVWVYCQAAVTEDLGRTRAADNQTIFYGAGDTRLHGIDSNSPSVTFLDADGTWREVWADVIAGCDGSYGPSRGAIPVERRSTWERQYPYSWLGILADVAPSTDELIYAWHPADSPRTTPASRSVSDVSR